MQLRIFTRTQHHFPGLMYAEEAMQARHLLVHAAVLLLGRSQYSAKVLHIQQKCENVFGLFSSYRKPVRYA